MKRTDWTTPYMAIVCRQNSIFNHKITHLTVSFSIQFQFLQRILDLALPLIQQQVLVVPEILFAAKFRDESRTFLPHRQFRGFDGAEGLQ